MRRVFIIGLMVLFGCSTRVHYDYFEPSGLGSTISSPPEYPKNVAMIKFPDGCELMVAAVVSERDQIVVTLRAMLPPETGMTFVGNRAKLITGGGQEDLNLSWEEWTLHDGVGSRREVPFDAPLRPRSFAKKPRRKGIEDMGNYESSFTLPEKHSSTRAFALILPGVAGHSSFRLEFVRKTADHRVWTQLQ